MTSIRLILISLFFCISSLAFADNQGAVTQYKQRLEQISIDENNPVSLAQKELYQQILSAYQEAVQHEAKAVQLRNLLERQPEETKKLEGLLKEGITPPNQIELQKFSLAELEQKLALAKARSLELEQSRDRLRKEIEQSDQKLISLRETLVQLKQKTLPNGQENGELSDALFALRAAKIQALELEILSLPSQNEHNRLNLEITNRKLEQESLLIIQLQDLIQSKRRVDAEETLQNLSADDAKASMNPLIAAQLSENQALSKQLRDVLADGEKALKQRRFLEAKLNLVRESYITVQQQLELSTKPLGVELRKFTRRLTKPINTEDTREQINQLRLINLEIAQQQFVAEQPEQTLPFLTEEETNKLEQLQNDKRMLSNRIREASNQTINELSQLLSIQEQINKQIKLGKELISKHLLWIPSILPVSSNWLTEIHQGMPVLQNLILPTQTHSLWKTPKDWLPEAVALVLLSLLALFARKHYRRNALRWKEQIGNVIHDRFNHTFNLVLLPLLITLPIPASILFLSQEVLNTLAWSHEAIPLISQMLAVFSWAYATLLLWFNSEHGLMQHHFSAPEKLCSTLIKLLHPLFWVATPLVAIILLIDESDSTTLRSGIGRLAFLMLAVLITLFWTALWKVAPQINQVTHSTHWWQRAQLWLAGLVGIHLLIILAAFLGYVFTGSVIMLILLVLTSIFYATFIFFKLGNRWLLIEERCLAFDRAKARRTEILEAREKNEEVPPLEENYINLQTISDQARVLLKATTVLVFLSLVWLLLKNALPTLDVLDKIVLWSNDITTSTGIISESITLKNILFSISIIVLCILAAYNLPGLLELLVLRHIDLSPGTSYAITSITKYILLVVSIMAGASQLGLEWAKLQWLVAALGVGLGFGLQEIVANFVSGLILLFEKPIRIGDTVTIGNFSGSVTRIQIRATTIVDWDRKEVIIPNKNFVTDQLINWSLTDPITRVVIPVGVAYGSDTQLAQELLLKVAHQHPKVLKDPEPNAYFLAFGASTLDMELRLFVSSMSDRLTTTHEINQAIDAAFKAHNIEIAFPQLDIHLHRGNKS